MTGWAPRRFWSEVSVVAEGAGFTVLLDSRPVRTPAKAPLVLPSRSLAVDVASEWEAQGEVIDPRTMPVTRTANAAIAKDEPHPADVLRQQSE